MKIELTDYECWLVRTALMWASRIAQFKINNRVMYREMENLLARIEKERKNKEEASSTVVQEEKVVQGTGR